MRVLLSLTIDVEEDAELGDLRDLRSHVAAEVERRREVRSVDDVMLTVDLAKELAS